MEKVLGNAPERLQDFLFPGMLQTGEGMRPVEQRHWMVLEVAKLETVKDTGRRRKRIPSLERN